MVRQFVILLFTSLALHAAEPLRVSYTAMPVSAPIILARERGWFEKAGLNIQLVEYALGKIALEDMSKGKLDVAAAAVTPIVYKQLAGDDFRIIATMASSTGMVALAARRDFGVSKIEDIQGKRVGYTRGTSGEFFFESMRILNRVPRDGLRVEDRNAADLVAGLKDGTLDVVSTWEPEIEGLRQALTNRLALFYGNGLYTFTWSFAALPKTIDSRRSDLEKFLRVIFDAAEFIERNPARAREEFIRKLGGKGKEIALHIEEARFRPQLSQELLVQLEGEARWIFTRENASNSAPNFLRILDTSILKKIRPSAVSVIE